MSHRTGCATPMPPTPSNVAHPSIWSRPPSAVLAWQPPVGILLDHEYSIGEGRDNVAEVSKKWFRIADTYGVEIEQGQNGVLMLAVAVCIDEMAHPDR
jgi:hypothetical protein